MEQRYFEDVFGRETEGSLYSRIIKVVYNTERMLIDVLPVVGAREGP